MRVNTMKYRDSRDLIVVRFTSTYTITVCGEGALDTIYLYYYCL